ncbi:MAG: type I-E CRISPR-associated endoribonuclease Cas2e [Cyanobacteria bacterium J06639_14]
MIVLVLENAKPSLRGEISRWLFEIKVGVFAGCVSALVRDELWGLIEDKIGTGSALMVYPQRNEQGFDARMLGNPSRKLVDIEGILLVQIQ